ncbi:hypothetical protein ACP70R_004012 [Stipagrostis hirtigluma subsp. patula]
MMLSTTVGHFLLVLLASAAQIVISNSLYGNETDRLSLLDFKKAISLDPQQALISWNDSTHFCHWEGVHCRVRNPGRVSSLNLRNRGLVGNISPSLGNLTYLKHLFLETNMFSGQIPPSLGQLRQLHTLVLANNTLQGIIPSFANCSDLKMLVLYNNNLAGQTPIDWPHHLEHLELSRNNLTGTIPTSLANITMLNVLACSSNNIEGTIPNELGRLRNLQVLYLDNNKLEGMFPQAILNLSALNSFYLSFNGLSGEVPSNLGSSLPNLTEIILDYNFFSGHIPSSFTNASNIGRVSLSMNNFTGVVPTSTGQLSKLSRLNLEFNQLQAHNKEEWEFMHSLVNCSELYLFSMHQNRLRGNVPDSLGNICANLQILFLGQNQLSGGFPTGISNLPNLIALGLDDNHFIGEVPEWLGTLKHLQVLALHRNKFNGPIPSSLSNLSQLGEFVLHFNQFDGHLPASLGKLQMLNTLRISNNFLHGMIPREIFGIPTVTEIDLSSNNLYGELPDEVGNARQLRSFLLSSNKLSGDIPNTLGSCDGLEYVFLDQNSFSGSIPTSLGNISTLIIINVSLNNLTGYIPMSLGNLQLLQQLDLSFNNLKGEVPRKGIFSNISAIRIEGNSELCGEATELHLPVCPAMPGSSSKQKQSIVKKVVIPLACFVSLAIFIAVMILWSRKQRRISISLPSFGSTFPTVSYNDLSRATERFSEANLIGKGRYSSVYQGKLFQDRTVVAVKVFNLETEGTQKSFIAECNALRNIRHRNLVPILTVCSSIDSNGNDFKALVYEFMPQGDLHVLLYSTRADGDTSYLSRITLGQRISIVVDVADALEYLHHNNQGTIVHCDLKPSNILLDDNMIAHVGDFGLARFIVDSTGSSITEIISASSIAINGTVGYVPPEYAAGSHVSSAGDVYSFGIVVLEIFLRRRPTDDMFKDELNISRFVEMNFPDRISHILDPELLEEQQQTSVVMKEKSLECLHSVLKIGLCCANPSPNERMDMREVAARLHRIKAAYLSGE